MLSSEVPLYVTFKVAIAERDVLEPRCLCRFQLSLRPLFQTSFTLAVTVCTLQKEENHAARPQVSLVAAAQGCVLLQPGLLQSVLTTAVADHGALLVAQREDQRERVSLLTRKSSKLRSSLGYFI